MVSRNTVVGVDAPYLIMEEAGYLYVYVSNKGRTTDGGNVYFDALRINHKKGHIIQKDHYYPFGLTINALSSSAPLSKPNKFKYNGKEEQTEFDLGWYDYGARNYDTQIGRFMTIDPLAETYSFQSPYAYAANNPIKFIDVNGMGPGDPPGWSKKTTKNKDGTTQIDVTIRMGVKFNSDNISQEGFNTTLLPVFKKVLEARFSGSSEDGNTHLNTTLEWTDDGEDSILK